MRREARGRRIERACNAAEFVTPFQGFLSFCPFPGALPLAIWMAPLWD